MTTETALQRLEAHYRAMPPVAALQPRVAACDGIVLRLHAPLAANVNDKQCAFGGSLASLMTLAAWGLVSLKLEAASLAADVYVADSQVRYLAPLFVDLEASARLADGEDWEVFEQTLRARGRARLQMVATVALPGGGVAAQFEGRYVAIAKR